MTRKNICLLMACLLFVGVPCIAKAATADTGVKSKGNIIYESDAGSVKLYGEDIVFLQEKLASIPEEIFDPVLYSHIHQWEYMDITQSTHKKHCAICGSAYDIVNPHTAVSNKTCNISYEKGEYPGYEKTCECGYGWIEEMYHNLVCVSKDENYHITSCVLAGTQFCAGIDPQEDPHDFISEPTDADHHQNVCENCGYVTEPEACTFDNEIKMEDMEPVEVRKYCACGNYIIVPDQGEVVEPENPDSGSTEDEDTTRPEQTEEEASSEEKAIENVAKDQNKQNEKGGAR